MTILLIIARKFRVPLPTLVLIVSSAAFAHEHWQVVEVRVANVNQLENALNDTASPNDDTHTRIIMEAGVYPIDWNFVPNLSNRVDIIGEGDVVVEPAAGYEREFVSIESAAIPVVFDNITIRNFRFTPLSVKGSLTLKNCTFENNSSPFEGGVIRAGGTLALIIENCIFTGNSAAKAGGVIWAEDDDIRLTNTIFRDNQSTGVGGVIDGKNTNVIVEGSTFETNEAGDTGGALHVTGASSVKISDSTFKNNSTPEDGAAIFASDESSVSVKGTTFEGNIGDDGGAIKIDGKLLEAVGNTFTSNGRIVGGAINATVRDELKIVRNLFSRNFAIFQDGSDIAAELVNPESKGVIAGNLHRFVTLDQLNRILRLQGRGQFKLADNSSPMPRDRTYIQYRFFNQDLSEHLRLRNNAVGGNDDGQGASRPLAQSSLPLVGTACQSAGEINGFPFLSDGYNIFSDDSCPGDGPGDMNDTDPMFLDLSENTLGELHPDSPAIDGGPLGLIDGELPCDYKDIRGLARPQDGDGDGEPQCDVGAWEMQAGDDLVAAASGAYFDTTRSGEGVFLEMLGGGLALVYVFTYLPDGSGQAWMLGIGNVVGNSVVIDELLITRGAIFGDDFDPEDVERIPWGSFSMSLPDCQAGKPGVMALTGNADMGYEALLSRPVRLTTVLDCPEARLHDVHAARSTPEKAIFSGSWFDPEHDGEGFILEILSEDTALLQWFTYDGEGNQFWVQGVGSIDGMTLTFEDAYYTTGGEWGSGFDADVIELPTWGDVVIEIDDCNTATASYDSVLAAFGEGSQDLTRLTVLDGLACDA